MQFTRCHLLHWSLAAGNVPDVPEHVHNFYQIELCVNGFIQFNNRNQKIKLKSGEWMLIPPGTAHSMTYGGKDLQYYSFKFEVENLPQPVAPQLFFQPVTPLGSWVLQAFAGQHPSDKYLFLPINENRPVLECLLLSMLQQVLTPLQNPDFTPQLLRDLTNLVAEGGALTNVQNAAENLNLNVSQLKYRYRQVRELPGGKSLPGTPKEFIDQKLMHEIDRFLFYSSLTLTQIARQTNFNNIYTFSRFVKRMTGQSPLHRRQNHYASQSCAVEESSNL